jgi:alpha-beta hydrolase superfamily lysophospholipase
MMLVHSEFELASKDGLRLFGQNWAPEGDVRAVACLVHGLGEHSGRYAHVAQALADGGFALMAVDWRGHGRSEGQRGHAAHYEAILDDIECLLQAAAGRHPGQERFLYGHSLGGGLVLNYVLRRRPALAGVIATGPALRPGFQPPRWKVAFGRATCRLLPALPLSNELDVQAISHDPAIVQAYRADPLNHYRVSVRLGIDILDSGEWALAHAADFPLPLLLMHGSRDRITSAPASRLFAERVGGACTLRIWDGCYHELHNEPEQAAVLACLVEWLSARTTR